MRSKKTNAALHSRCKDCVEGLAAAYPLQQWEQLMLKKSANPAFQMELELALKVHQQKVKAAFHREGYSRETCVGYLIEREFRFFPLEDCFKAFPDSPHPRALGLDLERLQVAPGKLQDGVLLRTDPPGRGLAVKGQFFVHGHLQAELFPAEQQVRPGQGAEIFEAFEMGLCQAAPKKFEAFRERRQKLGRHSPAHRRGQS